MFVFPVRPFRDPSLPGPLRTSSPLPKKVNPELTALLLVTPTLTSIEPPTSTLMLGLSTILSWPANPPAPVPTFRMLAKNIAPGAPFRMTGDVEKPVGKLDRMWNTAPGAMVAAPVP
jgi:hypothetical protein